MKDDWIKDRLPDKDGKYLVTKNYCGHRFVSILSFSTDLYKIDEYTFYEDKGKAGWYNYDSEYGYVHIDKKTIIGWQDLPEPCEV